MKNILKLSPKSARNFFLKEESYCNFDLPPYFTFKKVIKNISKQVDGKLLSDFYGSTTHPDTGKQKATYPSDFENVNYKFLNNKDGKFAWRPFQLVHPALYVSLVHRITEKDNWDTITKRFEKFDKNKKIKCHSIPLKVNGKSSDKNVIVYNWWQSVEQQSIVLALKYEYILHIDIADCYGSLYTHSIAWALHTKNEAKKNKNDKKFIGNIIDKHLQDMSFGQTNGIPQGSVLMDFIAEIVLGYADLELSKKIKRLEIDYQIIRYRDDYRIFTNNPQEAELIVKNITEIITELGMRLNSQKTLLSNNVIQDSIKADKLYWMVSKKGAKSLQQHLLVIHQLAKKYPNSGSLSKSLDKFFNRLDRLKTTKENMSVLVSIIIDIAYKNPRTYPIVAAILSKLFLIIDSKKEKRDLLKKIKVKFYKIPNTGYLQIWLQRIVLKDKKSHVFREILCEKVNDTNISIWNSDWLNASLSKIIEETDIINLKTMRSLKETIESKEVQLFKGAFPDS
ncbi:Reverse transcriptase (RNA-dependent DNA polymerase) [Candidatus Electrothrix communis]|uniref:Reverse transcriptase (RNA-dependent DNA polymerase) n=1 Tax=Candidatus Electrothrix communis TaxID=1859133 RepID=A0A3S3QWL5_9BACT|nr:Reverse transcriptase (RNA-dependent DNA polymerase) [Candidatus Electrothrix communis]